MKAQDVSAALADKESIEKAGNSLVVGDIVSALPTFAEVTR